MRISNKAQTLCVKCLPFLLIVTGFEARILGKIGTNTGDTEELAPSLNGQGFFLDTFNEATADGVITELTLCFTLPVITGGSRPSVFRAVVGFYRERVLSFGPRTRTFYALTGEPIVVTVDGDASQEQDSFQCINLPVPAQSVEEGYSIGVCSRRFPEESVGELVVTSQGNRTNTLVNEPDELEDLCPSLQGDSSLGLDITVGRSELDTSRRILRVFGNITGEYLLLSVFFCFFYLVGMQGQTPPPPPP